MASWALGPAPLLVSEMVRAQVRILGLVQAPLLVAARALELEPLQAGKLVASWVLGLVPFLVSEMVRAQV